MVTPPPGNPAYCSLTALHLSIPSIPTYIRHPSLPFQHILLAHTVSQSKTTSMKLFEKKIKYLMHGLNVGLHHMNQVLCSGQNGSDQILISNVVRRCIVFCIAFEERFCSKFNLSIRYYKKLSAKSRWSNNKSNDWIQKFKQNCLLKKL